VGISLTKGKVQKKAARGLRASITKRSQKPQHAEDVLEYYRLVDNRSFLALNWPVVRQIANKEGGGLGDSALSERSGAQASANQRCGQLV